MQNEQANDEEKPERLTAEELQELYEEQMRRLACPSCGEEPFRG